MTEEESRVASEEEFAGLGMTPPRSDSGSSSGRRARRRGGGKGGEPPKWRSGPPPLPPELKGTLSALQGRPYRLWLQRVERWRSIAQHFYPQEEQAWRLRDAIDGEPAEELQVFTDTEGNSYWNVPEGVDRVKEILDKEYRENALIHRAKILGDFEHVKRRPGEGLSEYVARFKRLLRARTLAGKADIDSEDLAFKLLNTASLDKMTKQNILTSAGHVWAFERICSSIRIMFPRPHDYKDVVPQSGEKNHRSNGGKGGTSVKPFQGSPRRVAAAEAPPTPPSQGEDEEEALAEADVTEEGEGEQDDPVIALQDATD